MYVFGIKIEKYPPFIQTRPHLLYFTEFSEPPFYEDDPPFIRDLRVLYCVLCEIDIFSYFQPIFFCFVLFVSLVFVVVVVVVGGGLL